MEASGKSVGAAGAGPRGHILVVDDEPGVREVLHAALSREGYDVSTAADAHEADACRAAQHPSVAIVDIHLPEISGLEVCERFSRGDAVEVILITGDDRRYSYEDAIESGACDFLLKPIRLRELAVRVERALAARKIRIERDETARELHRLSITDGLTGLYNSRHFFQQLPREFARAGRYGHAVSLIVLDLDHFKQVNDACGHQEGDRVLRHVAAAIRKSMRDPDMAFRYGGDEFAVLVPETEAQAAMPLAQRILQSTAYRLDGHDGGTPLGVTASLGIAQWEAGEDAKSLIHRADMAMYAAKRDGRNRIVMAAPHRAKGAGDK